MGRRTPQGKPLIQQLVALKRLPLTCDATIKRNTLRWVGKLQPTKYSETYLVQMQYTGRGRPVVTVVSPLLDVPDGEALPHTFPGDELCLHYPGEWDETQTIATTIVPWVSEWLLHYELWKATGDWHGGGHEPPKSA